MTTAAYRDGILAADSQATTEDGVKTRYEKLVRLRSVVAPVKGEVLLACAGDVYPALLFRDWLESGSGPNLHDLGVDRLEDFEALIVHKSGLYTANRLCRIDRVLETFWAIGSGRAVALGAMERGATARQAVQAAARWDSYTSGPVRTLELSGNSPKRKRSSR